MISIHSVSDPRYYTNSLEKENHVRSGADNYYAGAKAPSAWAGEGAKLLGIAGQPINAEKFKEILGGVVTNPDTGKLQQMIRDTKSYVDKKTGERMKTSERKGWDLTISAPKAVSILGLVGGDRRVLEAHKSAVSKALAYVEKYGANTRIKNGGDISRVKTGNLVIGIFGHETSRSDDPQLHSHCVLMNLTYDADAKMWRALSNEEIFSLRASADLVYKVELANLLTQLGYDVSLVKTGASYEIAVAGITKEHEQIFSQRSVAINEFKESMDGAIATKERDGIPLSAFEQKWARSKDYDRYQIATLETRGNKTELTKDDLQQGWKDLAQKSGLVMPEAKQLASTSASNAADVKGFVRSAISHLSERNQAFSRSDLIKESCVFSMGKVGVSDIEAEVDKFLKSSGLIEKNDRSLTTLSAIRDERSVINAINNGKGYGGCVLASNREFEKVKEAFEVRKSIETGNPFKLTDQQVNAAKNILMHPDRFQAVQGAAGTGKTASLEFVVEVAKGKGWNIVGLAPTARAAHILGKEAGISNTITTQKFTLSSASQDLARMKDSLAKTLDAIKDIRRATGTHDMNVATLGFGFAKDRYAFSKNGDVFKATRGLFGMRNTVAQALVGRSGKAQYQAKLNFRSTNSLGGLLSAGGSWLSARMMNQAGQDLTRWTKVGVVEGFIAKVAHASKSKDDVKPMLERASELRDLIKAIEQGKTLIIMDEAGLSGAKDMAKAIEKMQDMGASKGVIQGDWRQHGSVPAGAIFKQMQDEGIKTSVIDEVKRQAEGTVALEVVKDMMRGDFRGALEKQRWVETGADMADLYKGAANAYFAEKDKFTFEQIAKGAEVGVICPINKHRDAISDEIRVGLKERGVIEREGVAVTTLRDAGLSFAQSKLAFNYDEGQVLVVNIGVKGLKEGEHLTVVGIDAKKNTITVQKENGKESTIDANNAVGNKNGQEVKNLQSYNAKEREYAVGEKIVATSNIRGDRDLGVEKIANGTFGKVKALGEGGSVTIEFNGKERELSRRDLAKTEHGYVSTSVKAQGETNQRQIAVMPSDAGKAINEKQLYVTNTRARDETVYITDNKEKILNSIGQSSDNSRALENKPHEVEKIERTEELRRGYAPTSVKVQGGVGLLAVTSKNQTHESKEPKQKHSGPDIAMATKERAHDHHHVSGVSQNSGVSQKTEGVKPEAEKLDLAKKLERNLERAFQGQAKRMSNLDRSMTGRASALECEPFQLRRK